jgi:hypothetical protein
MTLLFIVRNPNGARVAVCAAAVIGRIPAAWERGTWRTWPFKDRLVPVMGGPQISSAERWRRAEVFKPFWPHSVNVFLERRNSEIGL